ncbi:MAG: hypothetical protein M3132_15550, partial [Actinomycetia bacterium]|nr:hypothetical protein [Actinomycetes bacterium]
MKNLLLEEALSLWFEDVRGTRPLPEFWLSDLPLPSEYGAFGIASLTSGGGDDIRRSVADWRAALTAVLSERSTSAQDSGNSGRTTLRLSDLSPTNVARALEGLVPSLLREDSSDDEYEELYRLIDELPHDVWEAIRTMDEFFRWATWRGLFTEDPFEGARMLIQGLPSRTRTGGKTYHGGPAFDTGYEIDVALSGGGHRATLFGLGALMAIKDRGRPPWRISSVSGGSITNVFLAYHHWSRMGQDILRGGVVRAASSDVAAEQMWQQAEDREERSWEAVTRELFDTVVDKGVLTRPWLAIIGGAVLLPPFLFLVAAIGGFLPSPPITIGLLSLWALVVLFRGLLVEWLIARRYFKSPRTVSNLWSLYSGVEHIVCATDLASGRPLYASSAGRLVLGGRPPHRVYRGDRVLGLPLSQLVRASAGFPGIPPRRLSLRHMAKMGFKQNGRKPSAAFLSDGGIW